ncbi:hypothetical protein L228DRAFT_268830 [Xylona heveae TC161]|uniref:Uncharacterized protein n=1 Tax=Xylona heveae (strain CBS 132557 / TC161) TaxID=1328760 RepID=A0A165GM40_XYLHT|nr:hypothetical protein L228DRAFT_268830 [Xylona heveae TC161]KZF22360.1 hypothetical protein L228DRAFT_268830 [Xylona heveae TC161]
MNSPLPSPRQRLSIGTSNTLGQDISSIMSEPSRMKLHYSVDVTGTRQHPPPPPPSPVDTTASRWAPPPPPASSVKRYRYFALIRKQETFFLRKWGAGFTGTGAGAGTVFVMASGIWYLGLAG